jgi:hypothetical protein
VEALSISLGFFPDDAGIDDLAEKGRRLGEYDFIDIGKNKGRRLFELQTIKELSYTPGT